MPSTVGAQIGARMHKIATDVQKANRTAVPLAALASKTVLATAINATAPGGKLRGVGQNGAKVGVRFDIKPGDNPTALVRATGPLHLIENPSKPHQITPRPRRGKRALFTPYGPRASVQHPGVRNPKRPWAKAKPAAEAAANKVLGRTYISAFRRGATR